MVQNILKLAVPTHKGKAFYPFLQMHRVEINAYQQYIHLRSTEYFKNQNSSQ